MKLTRRDALAALAAAGVGSLAGCNAPVAEGDATAQTPADVDHEHVVETHLALAEVVYPSELGGVEEFVRTYTSRRLDGDEEHAAGVADAVRELDDYADTFHGARYVELDEAARLELLDVMSVDAVDPDPAGTRAQRVRYYLVNDLLFALYSSPTGAELVGLENPPGHPGGTRSYRTGPST